MKSENHPRAVKKIFLCYVAIIWGSGEICNQLPPLRARQRHSKQRQLGDCEWPQHGQLLFTLYRDWRLHTGLHCVYVTEVIKCSILLHSRAGLQLYFLLRIYGLFFLSLSLNCLVIFRSVQRFLQTTWEWLVGLVRLASTVCSSLPDLYPVNNPANLQQPLWSL